MEPEWILIYENKTSRERRREAQRERERERKRNVNYVKPKKNIAAEGVFYIKSKLRHIM